MEGPAVILLDTNVISELMRPQPEPRVLAWADGLDPDAVAITAMNEAEILHGLARLPDGRRKQQLQQGWKPWRPSCSLAGSGPSPAKQPTGMAICCCDANS
jgi:hypothetical protein